MEKENNNSFTAVLTIFISVIVIAIIVALTMLFIQGIKQSNVPTDSNSSDFIYPVTDTLTSEGGIQSSSVTVYNQTWLNLDGVNDYINLTNNENFLENESVLFVCGKVLLENSTKDQGILSDRRLNNNWTMIRFTATNNVLQLICKNGTTESSPQNGINYFNEWTGFCVGYNSNYIITNINGYNINFTYDSSSLDICQSKKLNTQNPLIGNYYDLTKSLNGSLDYLYIFNRTLSQKEMFNINNMKEIINVANVDNISLSNSLINITSTIIVQNGSINDFDYRIRELGNILFNATGNGEYILTYSGWNGTNTDNNSCTGWANSTDGITWVKQNKTITTCTGNPSNSINSTQDPYLIYNGTHYFLYVEDTYNNPFRNISLYISTNMKDWIYYPSVVGFNSSNYSSRDVSSPTVFKENNNWYMLYEGRDITGNLQNSIGLAKSNNGINWTKESEPFLTGSLNNWDRAIVPDDIIKFNDKYYIIYHGYCPLCKNASAGYSSGFMVATNISDSTTYSRPFYNYLSYIDDSLSFFNDGTNRIAENKNDNLYINLSYLTGGTILNYSINTTDLVFKFNLNENNGTIAYDSSGNGNNGTISGATWQTDGIILTLTDGVDYSLNKVTGVLTMSNDYLYSWVMSSWIFESNNTLDTSLNVLEQAQISTINYLPIVFLAVIFGAILGYILFKLKDWLRIKYEM